MFGKHVSKKESCQAEEGNHKIIIRTLQSMDEERAVIAYGRQYVIILKLETLNKAEKQRVIDFICGAAYVFAMQIIEVDKDIYLLAPKHVRLTDNNSLMDSGHETAI